MSPFYKALSCLRVSKFFIILFSLLLIWQNGSAQLVPGFTANGRLVNQGDTVTICIGGTIIYQSTAQGGFTAIRWRFRNGTPLTGSSTYQSINYPTAGIDSTVQVITLANDSASTYIFVKVTDVKPVANFTFAPDGMCGDIPVVFANGSTGNGLSYLWNFGDQLTSNQGNPSHQFLTAIGTGGTQQFNVKLITTNDQYCKDSITKVVTVKKIPDASVGNGRSPEVIFGPFNGDSTFRRCENIASYEFRFRNASSTTSIISQWTIHWGDSSPDSVFTSWPASTLIRHTYPKGKSILTITVQGTNGCVGIKTYNVFLGTTPAGGYASLGNTSICAPNLLQFVITGYNNNALGTTYTVTTSDGSVPDFYQHPPPDTFNHIFNVGSCGITSNSYANAFSSTLFVENPCGSTTVSVVPIYVSGKPRANFTFTPNVCTNTSVLINNATAFGGQITPTGGTSSTCTNSGRQVWKITPSTGYTITTGALGDTYGDPTNSSIWTIGSTYMFVNFIAPGTYTIKLYVANDLCGVDSITKTICVRTPPTASFAMNKHNGCATDTVSITNTSLIGNCGGETYNWQIAYTDDQNCGTSNGASFVSGTTSITRDAKIRFTAPGRYIITLTETATATGCTSATFRDTFYVKAKPKLVLAQLPKVCLGNPVNPFATVINCYSGQTPIYHWTFTGGLPATSDSLNPGPVTYPAVGIYTVTFSAENECGITTVSAPDTVITVPLANAGIDTSTCSGVPVRIGISTGTYTYLWSPAIGLSNANIATPNLTLTYNGPSADTTFRYVLMASAGTNCSNSDTVFVKIKRKPPVTITPTSAVSCNGSPAMLVATGAATYSWSPTSTLNSSNTDTVFASPTGTNPTIYTVTGTQNGCTNIAQITVTPRIVRAGPDSLVCNSSTGVQFTGTPAGGTWSPNPPITPGGLFNPNAAGNGTYDLIYTYLGCTDTLKAFVTSGEAARAGADSAICQAVGTIQLTGLPTGGSWGPNPPITPTGLLSTNTPGTYNLIYRIGSGSCISRDTVTVTVNGGITNNLISANQNICPGGQPVQINGQPISGGGVGSVPQYTWEQSTDSISWSLVTPLAIGLNFTPPAGLTQTMFYRRKASTSLCSGPQTNISIPVKVTINPDAKALFTPTRTVGCIPFAITADTINLTPFNNAVSQYQWYVNGALYSTNQIFPTYTINIPGDSITIKLVAISRFGCKNDSMQMGFKTVPRPTPAFTQNDSVGCGPLSITFTNLTPNAAQYSYFWNFGTGQTSSLLQPAAIPFPPNPLSGDTVYTVRFITISQCSRDTLLRYVRVKAKPKALFTPDRSTGCSSYNFTFTNTSRGNGNTYIWNFGDGSSSVPTNAATVQHIYHTGVIDTFNVKLIATNECGTDSLIYKLVVQPITIRPDFAINGNERFGCGPSHTVHFINNSQGGSAFKWRFGNGDSLLTYRNVDTITYTYNTAGTFIVTMQASNSCSDTTDVETITVYPKPAVAFTASPLTACFGDTIRFFNNSDTGLVNNWRFGDGSLNSPLRNPIHVYAVGGNYTVRLLGTRAYPNGTTCSDSAFANILVRDTLAGLFTASDTAVGCTPAVITFKNANRPAALTTWTFGDNTTANGDSVTHSYGQPGVYVVKMTSRGIAGCTYTYSKTITVTSPAGSIQYNSGYLCPGIPLRMQATVNNTTQQIRYIFGNGDSLTTTASLIFYTYPQPGIYVPYALAISGNCQARLVRGDTVRVDRLRVGFRTQQQQQCGSTTATFTDTSNAFFGIQSYRYDFGDNTFSTQQNPVKIFTTSGTYNVRLRITGVSGCVDTITIPVVVSVRRYPVSTIGGDSLACIGQPIALSALVQSTDAIASYNWDFGNGVTGTGATTTALYNVAGTYTVRLISRTAFGCADTVYKNIRVNTTPLVNVGPDVTICRGDSIQLSATGATNWQWSPLQGLSCVTCYNPVAKPLFTTTYVATGSNNALCRANDTIVVQVVQRFNMVVSPTTPLCIGDSVQLFATGAYTYAWSPAASIDNPVLNNPFVKPATTTIYQVIGKDRNNCFTDTDYVRVNVGRYPTVALGPDRSVTAGETITLTPIITNGPIVRYQWTPTNGLTCATCSSPNASVTKDMVYRLEVENEYGCKARDTISVSAICGTGQMYVANVFSPDGDGTNDVFLIRGKGIAIIKNFRIFNRWGQVVFERSNINANDVQQGWNGNINGVPAQIDVYVVTAEVVCTKGEVFNYKGNVTLLR